MLFNSYQFLIFLPMVLSVYYVIPVKVKYLWLLLCSYYFYMCWNAKYALLMLFSTVVTYICSLLLEYVKHTGWDADKKTAYKKMALALSFALNLLVLGYFKYTNFAVNVLENILNVFHITLHIPTFDIILPVGISFYTFQALGYTMDVYRDEIYAEKNFFRYALFVSFFPQLVAGPIERSKNLLKQLAVHKPFSFEQAKSGVFLMLWGYFLKVVLADRIAMIVDVVYGDYASYDGLILMIATVLFAFQIYCDFYGYSVIAVGCAKILGIHLMENFKAPYLSFSVAEFWRNWHISLTSWFKDYLYIPLGGSRKGKIRKYVNKLIVFLVSGLWHGAGLSFVAWGFLNGVYQIIEEILKPAGDRLKRSLRIRENNSLYKLMKLMLTFVLVDFSWIFFRADSLTTAVKIVGEICSVNSTCLRNLLSNLNGIGLHQTGMTVIVLCLLILLFADICKKNHISVCDKIMAFPWWLQSVLFVLFVCAILVFGIWGPEYNQANFIYFQF